MSDKRTHVMSPSNKDAVSNRKIELTPEDRAKHLKDFREDKAEKQRIKEERFAKIEERRKSRGGDRPDGGINIVVESDKK